MNSQVLLTGRMHCGAVDLDTWNSRPSTPTGDLDGFKLSKASAASGWSWGLKRSAGCYVILLVFGVLLHEIPLSVQDEAHSEADNTQAKPSTDYSSLHFPEKYITLLHNDRHVGSVCREVSHYCWCYEKSCIPEFRFSFPICSYIDLGWTDTLESAQDMFWKQADFG